MLPTSTTHLFYPPPYIPFLSNIYEKDSFEVLSFIDKAFSISFSIEMSAIELIVLESEESD